MSYLVIFKKYDLQIFLLFTILINACRSQDVLTNSYWIEFHHDIDHDEANKIAETHGFKNAGPVNLFFIF